jgi:hypothetical protein
MTELNPNMKSVHTCNDSSQRRRVPIICIISLESDSCLQVEMTEMTPKVNIVHTSNDSFAGETRATQRGH